MHNLLCSSQGAAAIFLALNFPKCRNLESIDLSVNGISDEGGTYLISSLLALFGAFELYNAYKGRSQTFLSLNDVATKVSANLPPFPFDIGSNVSSLTSIDLSRNR